MMVGKESGRENGKRREILYPRIGKVEDEWILFCVEGE
jgi:hypothetical protein